MGYITYRRKVRSYKQKSKTKIMSFTFRIRAFGLPVMDKGMEGSSADPYFKLYVDDDKIYESDHISNTLNPEWEEFTLDKDKISDTPKLSDIKMKIKDHDWGNSDDDIGKLHFKIYEHMGGVFEEREGIPLVDDDDECGRVFIHVTENDD